MSLAKYRKIQKGNGSIPVKNAPKVVEEEKEDQEAKDGVQK
jgi:hypothetical protein